MLVKEKNNIDLENVISMHFRLGDYKLYPDTHPILSEEYYNSALNCVLEQEQTNKSMKVLYFCEDSDIDEVEKILHKIKTEYPLIIFVRANPLLNDWEQLLLMSLCKHNIIANSTFSWWAAYLNNNPSKIVCYPEKWFGPKVEHDLSDLFPEDWVKIE